MAATKEQLAHYQTFLAEAKEAVTEPTHYLCPHCAELFPIEEALVRNCPEPVEFWNATYIRHGFEVMCPSCGDDQPEPCYACELCGIRQATEEGTDMCKVCYLENEAEQDATVERIKELQAEMAGDAAHDRAKEAGWHEDPMIDQWPEEEQEAM